MFDSKTDNSATDLSSSYNSGNNHNIPYFDSWAQSFVNLIRKAVAKHNVEGEEQSLVRYLKITILNENQEPKKMLSSASFALDEVEIIPDEPVSFNTDGGLTLDMGSPVRVSGCSVGDTLIIDKDFPSYQQILNALKDFERVYEVVADAHCFRNGPDDIKEELLEQAKDVANQIDPNIDLTRYIENIESDFPGSLSLDNYRTTPHTIAFLAYARHVAEERHKMPLREMFLSHGLESETAIISFIDQQTKAETIDISEIESRLTVKIYDKYEDVFDMAYDYGARM